MNTWAMPVKVRILVWNQAGIMSEYFFRSDIGPFSMKVGPRVLDLMMSDQACLRCSGICVRNGKVYGKQRYRCKACHRSFVEEYTYRAYDHRTSELIPKLVREGCGIRSIARVLGISKDTVLRRILHIARRMVPPAIRYGMEYEIDEMHVPIVPKRDVYITYALRRDDRTVVDFAVGARSNDIMRPVVDTVLHTAPRRIYTDRLKLYKGMIPNQLHRTRRRETNHIERKNLSMRTHLKRFGRKTLCYSRSMAMLAACLKIYFWA